MTDFGNMTFPEARKAHTCEWCGEDILPGEVHARYAGVWQGDWQNWRMHAECHLVANKDKHTQEYGFERYGNERGGLGEREGPLNLKSVSDSYEGPE